MEFKVFINVILLLYYCELVNGLRLKKVIVFSRHGIRAPLFRHLKTLSPKEWPKWRVESGYLTPKGALLESYMGEYFSAWLQKEELLHNECPEDNSVFIYSNYLNRTRGTAKAFSEAAFPNCNIGVHFKNVTFPNPQYDPVFPFLITNATEAFKQAGTQEIQENFNKRDFNDVYTKLNNISDIRHSAICESQGICDLTAGKDKIIFSFGKIPSVSGRFMIASWLVDSFVMGFYEGFPLNEIGWGEIKSKDQWKLLSKIRNEELEICYNITVMREVMRPLVKYLKKITEDHTIFTFIVGHDSNLSPLMFSMGFSPYVLPEQFENIPIGSKLVFQKWTDGENDFLKVELVYQSWKQIRDGEKLSLSNPPKNITMYFDTYNADENGMYPWTEFERILNDRMQ